MAERITTSESMSGEPERETQELRDRRGRQVEGGPATRRTDATPEAQAAESGHQGQQTQTGGGQEWHGRISHIKEHCQAIHAASLDMESSTELAHVLSCVSLVEQAVMTLEETLRTRDAQQQQEQQSQQPSSS